MLRTEELFDLSHTLAREYLARFRYPWEALPGLKGYIAELSEQLNPAEYIRRGERVWIHNTAVVASSAFIGDNVIIGPESEVRHCAFIRGDVLIGANCVVGNSVEVKNAVLFDSVQVPHFNYVGDSILGYKAHLGAGAVTSNVRADKKPVPIRSGDDVIQTGMNKCGAMVGDFAEIGCNAVLNPGTVIGRESIVQPLSSVRGAVPERHIWKNGGQIERIR